VRGNKSLSTMKSLVRTILPPSLLLFLPTVASAQDPAAAHAINTGDNAWLLASAALVLMMTGPGLALF